ncbi:MAG TPA: peptidase dimerization domain-containing protein [Anaerovoracaceae bacterium]|nr:peptidase dimerization domain-containing protein [Anaerovoracaceae bacterium]
MPVALIGTPAEETYGAKVEMVRRGVFDDVDVAFQAHLSHATSTCSVALAMDARIFEYRGKASHSAAAPWDGINALDAVQLLYAGINALRQHVKPDVRIHGIVTEGGQAANIVPDKAGCLFYIRSETRHYLDTVIPRIENAAKGSALMTGAKLKIKNPELPMNNLINLPILQELADVYFEDNGIPPTVTPEMAAQAAGSTDVGNVSHACPTAYVEVGLDGDVFYAHEESALKLVDSPEARKKMHQTICAMAGMAMDLAVRPEQIETAKKQLSDRK